VLDLQSPYVTVVCEVLHMRVFVQDHDLPPEQSFRQALEVLLKARIYTVDGGGIFGNRALVLCRFRSRPGSGRSAE
jgi:hypothetical protein